MHAHLTKGHERVSSVPGNGPKQPMTVATAKKQRSRSHGHMIPQVCTPCTAACLLVKLFNMLRVAVTYYMALGRGVAGGHADGD